MLLKGISQHFMIFLLNNFFLMNKMAFCFKHALYFTLKALFVYKLVLLYPVSFHVKSVQGSVAGRI